MSAHLRSRRYGRATLVASAALAVALLASPSTAHAQVVTGVFYSDAGAADTLTIAPGSAGKAALDTACGTAAGSQVFITGTAVGTAGVNGVALAPLPGGGGSDYSPSSWAIAGGSCAAPSGTIVLDMQGTSLTGSVISCPGMTGTYLSTDTIHQFSIGGTCAVNGWHFQITINAVGIVVAGAVPPSASETVLGVMYGLQTGTRCC